MHYDIDCVLHLQWLISNLCYISVLPETALTHVRPINSTELNSLIYSYRYLFLWFTLTLGIKK